MMIENLKKFARDERGASSMVFRLVLAVTVAAAILYIVLQTLYINKDSVTESSRTLGNGTRTAFTQSMETLSD